MTAASSANWNHWMGYNNDNNNNNNNNNNTNNNNKIFHGKIMKKFY